MGLSGEDRLEIQQLFARYNFALDSGDEGAFADCFTEDAFFDSPKHVLKGREGLKGFVREAAENNGTSMRHLVHNLLIAGGGDWATMKCYGITYRVTRKGVEPMYTATYHHKLKKAAGGWKITERKVFVDQEV